MGVLGAWVRRLRPAVGVLGPGCGRLRPAVGVFEPERGWVGQCFPAIGCGRCGHLGCSGAGSRRLPPGRSAQPTRGGAMSISSHHRTASGRPLRVSPAWVGGARPADGADDQDHLLPVREAVWIWSVRRYARLALWALPAAALLDGWLTLGIGTPPGPLSVALAADWLTTIAMIALAGLLAGTRTRRSALAGLLIGLAGAMLTLPLAALPEGAAAAGSPLTADQMPLAATGCGRHIGRWLAAAGLGGFPLPPGKPSGRRTPDAGRRRTRRRHYAKQPLPTVGALLLLAAGTGLAWTGGRLIPEPDLAGPSPRRAARPRRGRRSAPAVVSPHPGPDLKRLTGMWAAGRSAREWASEWLVRVACSGKRPANGGTGGRSRHDQGGRRHFGVDRRVRDRAGSRRRAGPRPRR